MDTFSEILSKLPPGCYPHAIAKFVDGTIRTTRDGCVVVPIKIGIEALGSPFNDLRAVLEPGGNDLIPVLVFIEPKAYEAARAAQPAQQGAGEQ